MGKSKRFSSVWVYFILVMFAGSFLFLASTQAQAQTAPIKWRAQTAWPQSWWGIMGVDYLKKRLDETVGKDVQISWHGPGDLVSTAESFNALRQGMVEMINSTSEYWMGSFPEAALEAGYPMTWRNAEDKYIMLWEMGMLDILREVYKEQGVFFPTGGFNMTHNFWATKPIRTLKDCKGLKIRAPGTTAKVFAALGMAPVFIPHEETYMALKLKTVDAAATSGTIYVMAKHYEAAPYYHLPKIGSPGNATNYINMAAWQKLPAHTKEVMMSVFREFEWYRPMAGDWYETQYITAKIEKDYHGKVVYLAQEVVDAAQAEGLKMLREAGAKSPRCGKIAKITEDYMRIVGYIK